MKWNQSQQIFPIFDLKNHSGRLWTTAALYAQTNMPCFCHMFFLLFHLNHFFSCNHAPGVKFPKNYSSLHIEESEGEKWKEGASIKSSNSSEKQCRHSTNEGFEKKTRAYFRPKELETFRCWSLWFEFLGVVEDTLNAVERFVLLCLG